MMTVKQILELCRKQRAAMKPWTSVSPYAYRNLVELQEALLYRRNQRRAGGVK